MKDFEQDGITYEVPEEVAVPFRVIEINPPPELYAVSGGKMTECRRKHEH